MLVNIEAERVRKQMTKEEFAKEMGIALKTYYNWINGVTAIPSTYLQKMSKFFGVQIEYLLEEREGGGKECGLRRSRKRQKVCL